MANVYPKNINFLLADAVRREEGGKLTLLGFYSGDTVLLKDTLPQVIPEGMEGLALPGLTIVATVRDGHGSFNCGIHLIGPNGKALGKVVDGMKLVKGKDTSANLLVPIQPFPIPEFGIYRVLLQLNKHEFEFKFRVAHSDPKATFPKVMKGKKLESLIGRSIPSKELAPFRDSKLTPGKRKT
jgi:hypothetical protein